MFEKNGRPRRTLNIIVDSITVSSVHQHQPYFEPRN